MPVIAKNINILSKNLATSSWAVDAVSSISSSYATTSSYAISANIITGNVFRGGSTHVLLESSSIYNKVYGNVPSDALSITVTDSGTNNLVGSTGN